MLHAINCKENDLAYSDPPPPPPKKNLKKTPKNGESYIFGDDFCYTISR